jgi:hypothetical protein
MLQFVIKIGGNDGSFTCSDPVTRSEGIIVDYSTDNEITWTVLKMVEPKIYNYTKEFVTLELPIDAKTNHTVFRWWQPLGYGGKVRLNSPSQHSSNFYERRGNTFLKTLYTILKHDFLE